MRTTITPVCCRHSWRKSQRLRCPELLPMLQYFRSMQHRGHSVDHWLVATQPTAKSATRARSNRPHIHAPVFQYWLIKFFYTAFTLFFHITHPQLWQKSGITLRTVVVVIYSLPFWVYSRPDYERWLFEIISGFAVISDFHCWW